MSKGSKQRPSQASRERTELGWELCSPSTTPERKAEIKALIRALEQGDSDNGTLD